MKLKGKKTNKIENKICINWIEFKESFFLISSINSEMMYKLYVSEEYVFNGNFVIKRKL